MLKYYIYILAIFLKSACAYGSGFCSNVFIEKSLQLISIQSKKNQLSPNPNTQALKGQILIKKTSFDNQTLTIPESIDLATKVISLLPPQILTNKTILSINLVSMSVSKAVDVMWDHASDRISVKLPQQFFQQPAALSTVALNIVKSSFLTNETFRVSKKIDNSIYITGLISISAEPPEAFFAASTRTEMQSLGFTNSHSSTASTWLIRSADSRSESIFNFSYPSEGRENNLPYNDKFLVTVGLGPENNPASRGFREADLLISGDEQQGVAAKILKVLSRGTFQLSDISEFKGMAIRSSPEQVILNNLNLTWSLTKVGFSDLNTNPLDYRKIISTEYDEFLSTLFENGKIKRNKISYLLATSRGCSQGCAICCSGGLSPFQYFTHDRIMQDLRKISELHPDEKQIDIFFIDSNFNNNPNRIIDFAKELGLSDLRERFRFFVRHNTLNGFLSGAVEGVKMVNTDLIESYKKLGIKEIMMGVDAYDNASALTLKSNRKSLAKKGVQLRPIYTFQEIFNVISEVTKRGLKSRDFLLTNNPFVSDLDRVDSYYNLFLLWAKNPRFSIDIRERSVVQLKPFEGSAVGDAAKLYPHLVKDGRFKTKGIFGELDESMNFSVYNQSADHAGINVGFYSLLQQRNYIVNRSLEILRSGDYRPEQKKLATAMLQKIKIRDQELRTLNLGTSAEDLKLKNEINMIWVQDQKFPEFAGDLLDFQKQLLSQTILPLQKSLSKDDHE